MRISIDTNTLIDDRIPSKDLLSFGGAVVPLSGVFPAVAHIPSWQEASEVLSVFSAAR